LSEAFGVALEPVGVRDVQALPVDDAELGAQARRIELPARAGKLLAVLRGTVGAHVEVLSVRLVLTTNWTRGRGHTLAGGCGTLTAPERRLARPCAYGRFGATAARFWTGMDFRILGPLEVLEQGRIVALGGSKQRALLALLLLHANQTLTAERLIDELWGERPPPTAAKTLQMHVSRLRKALAADAGAVVTRARGYELKLDPGCLDAHRFERLVAEGRGALAAGRPERALRTLQDALAIWRGTPLSDFASESFAQPEIARLDDLRLAAMELLVEAQLSLAGHAEVVGQLELLIAEHPYRERLRAQLMLALYRSDRQADALQAYQDARRVLVEELGIEPGERLRELERAILAQDPALHLPAEERAVESAVETGRGAFVGRGSELAELVGALDDVFAGHGRLFLLAGEPGIGKSRLADEVVARARARAARVVVGRCWEAGGAPGYWPWIQALRAYVREADAERLRAELGDGAADLAQLLPELRRRFPDIPDAPAPESEDARFRLFDAVGTFLRNAAGTRPLVVVLDDLHAADPPSLLLLRFLARELESTRVLVLGAYRDVDPVPGPALRELLAEVAREPMSRRIALRGLSEREVARYVELTASQIASSAVVAGLHAETEGNPLFLGEIVHLLSIEGVAADWAAEIRLAIPQSIRDVIARRLAHLSTECNRLLPIASVLGREFALDPLARMGGVAANELLDVLDEALTARVVSDVPDAPEQLRFAHVLIRDTLYDGLSAARRVRLHRLAVDALEALYGDRSGPYLAELAHHSLAGRDFDRGLRYARHAADRALAQLAYEEAARLYEKALEARDVGGFEEATRCELLLALGEAEMRAGNTPAAKSAFLTAAAVARRVPLARELARAAAGYGGRIVWARAGDDTQLVPLLEEGLAALGDEHVELRARLLARLAGALRDDPSGDRRDRLSGEAVRLARRAENPAALAYALDGRAASIISPATVEERLALGSELCAVGERIGDGERIVQAHCHRIMAQLEVGDVSGAEVDLNAARRITHELRMPAQLWQVCGLEAMLALAAGRLTEAAELIPRALDLGERAQPTAAIPVYTLQRYTLSEFCGELDKIEPSIRDLAAEYPARTVFRCALAHLHARLARLPKAKQLLDELDRDEFSVLPFDQEWLFGMSLLAETAALLGDTDAAAVLYGLCLPWAGRNVVDQAEGIRGSLERYLGLLAMTGKRWDDAELHFEHALTMNARMGARPWLAYTAHDYARMLRARNGRGDRERAQELLENALAIYRDLGMDTSTAGALAH
jgi:DNA-binding SARP family transcriptional activator